VKSILTSLVLLGLLGSTGVVGPAVKPQNAVDFVISAFATYPIIGLGRVEGAGNQSEAEFLAKLISNPRFDATVNDIVIECGNSRYQEVLDRYVDGEVVPLQQLQKVWRDTTQMFGCAVDPTTFELILAVRKANMRLVRGQRLRVLAADPPIDWSIIRTHEEFMRYLRERDSNAAAVIEHQVLGRRRRAFVVIGGFHLVKHASAVGSATITTLIEKMYAGSMYVIWPLTEFDTLPPGAADKLKGLPLPSIFPIAGTWFGALNGHAITSSDMLRRVGNKVTPVTNAFPGWELEDLFDACLFFGLPPSLKSVDYREPTDPAFLKELQRRRELMTGAKPVRVP
jgi:hypothetical protein